MPVCQYDQNKDFLSKAKSALQELFERARSLDELNFAASLSPEFRPYRRNSAVDAQYAFSDYANFLSRGVEEEIRPRVALAFYAHIAEASGFWEIPKNLISVCQGHKYNPMPFAQFTAKYGSAEGSPIPNANKLMRSLVRASQEAGLTELAAMFCGAFDSDLRNAFAHSDYYLDKEGIFIHSRYGHERVIDWTEVNVLLERAMHVYQILNALRVEHCQTYVVQKEIFGALNHQEGKTIWKVKFIQPEGAMVLSNGHALLQFSAYPNSPALMASEV